MRSSADWKRLKVRHSDSDGKKGQMAKDKYTTNVLPFLADIPKMYDTMTEEQIAKALGVSRASFENYKKAHPELRAVLFSAKKKLVEDLKETLKMKAKGYRYTEKKKTEKRVGGEVISCVEETFERYAQPDLGAIHLLLKNNDPEWHNDDVQTMAMKQKTVDIAEKKASENDWVTPDGE